MVSPDYDVARLLPHRPPLLLVDRILSVDLAAGHLLALRTVSADDPWLGPTGLPAPLLIEALCQAAACLNGLSLAASSAPAAHRGYLVGLSDVTFTAPAQAGDVLHLSVRREGGLGAMQAVRGEVLRADDGERRPLASGRLLLAVVAS